MFHGLLADRGRGTVTLFKSHNPAYPDGGQLRDFVYVKDCVATVGWLLQNPKVTGLFNVGTGVARSFLDLVDAVGAAVGNSPKIRFVDTPAARREAELPLDTHPGIAGIAEAVRTGHMLNADDAAANIWGALPDDAIANPVLLFGEAVGVTT